MPFQVIQTADLLWKDGLPVSKSFDDIYFSKENGLQEVQHVFIEGNDLIRRWEALSTDEPTCFVIAETGFGTGLNFLKSGFLWLKHAPTTARLHFISCEKHPLNKSDLARVLALWPELKTQADALLKQYPVLTPGFHDLTFKNNRIRLTLMIGDVVSCFQDLLVCGEAKLEKAIRFRAVDAWFLDGFAPAKNPDMWNQTLFETIAQLSKPKTTLATFTAAGMVKRGLESVGFKVDKKPGFGKKREQIVAEFIENQVPFSGKLTPWHLGYAQSVQPREAIVLGAGLAGCYTAHALSRRGWGVTLIDKNASPGQGASGNRKAVLFPKFSAFKAPFTEFMLNAYLFALRTYKPILDARPIGDFSGILQLASDQKDRNAHKSLDNWLAAYPQLGRLVSTIEASQLAGVPLKTGGIFIPDSGWLDSPALCEWLLSCCANITWVPETDIKTITFEGESWHAGDHCAPVLVIANGYQAAKFDETCYFPLKPTRGQMTSIASTKESAKLKIPICANGHVIPEYNGQHHIGATYHLGDKSEAVFLSDDISNRDKLWALPIDVNWSEESMGQWTGVRATTPDYLPLVGPVCDEVQFKQRFAALETNAKRWIPHPAPCYPGLYACTGFGSRGLTTIPLSAEWLAGLINNEFSCLPKHLIQAISPARFLYRKLIRKN